MNGIGTGLSWNRRTQHDDGKDDRKERKHLLGFPDRVIDLKRDAIPIYSGSSKSWRAAGASLENIIHN